MKKILLLVSLLCCVLLLASCGGEESCSHSEVEHYESHEATCAEPGNREYFFCKSCNKYSASVSFTETYDTADEFLTPNARHNSLSYFEAKAPTCTSEGNSKYWRCNDCAAYLADDEGKVETTASAVIIPATAHSGTLVLHEGTAATCTEDGIIDIWACTACSAYYSDAEAKNELVNDEDAVIPALRHEGTISHVEAKASTCSEDGNVEYWYCSACEYYFDNADGNGGTQDAASVVVSASHTYSEEWTYDGTEHWHAATCEHTDERADVAEHNLSDYSCTDCDYAFSGLTYDYWYSSLYGSFDGWFVRSVNNPTGDIVIPSTYEELPVIGIDSYAFADCTGITSITIPDGVRYISSEAFLNCTGLTEINIPSSVTSVSDNILSGCSNIKRINMPIGSSGDTIFDIFGTVEYEGSVLCNGYYIPAALTEINIISGTKLPDGFFKNFTLLGTQIAVTLPDEMTEIGESAFEGCTTLTSFDILPAGATVFGKYAFKNCTGLTEIVIPASITELSYGMFEGCSEALTVTLHGNITTIGENAFKGCSKINELVIPDSVTAIGRGAFSGWSSLTKITMPARSFDENNSRFGYLFGSEEYEGSTEVSYYYVPTSLTTVTMTTGNIIDSYFASCTMLKSVTIPADSTSIGMYAFGGCSGLTEMPVIPLGVTVIQSGTFNTCGFTEVVIPDHITEIGSSAFNDCVNLKNIVIPTSVTKFSTTQANFGFFKGCTSLESITIPFVGIYKDKIGDYSDSVNLSNQLYSLFGHMISNVPASLRSVTVLGGYIHNSAFKNLSGLTSITLPESMTSVGFNAFEGCTGLTEIVIPESATGINSYAFKGCTALKTVYLPAAITGIGTDVFSGCTALESIYADSLSSWLSIKNNGAYEVLCTTDAVLYIDGKILSGEVVIPENITEISKYAFYNFDGITSVVIHGGVTAIRESAFEGCVNLKDVIIADGAQSIYGRAFAGCRSIEEIVLPAGSSIGDSAFVGCSGLKKMTIPEVGYASIYSDSSTHVPFGRIFGTEAYDGGIATKQYRFEEGYYTNGESYFNRRSSYTYYIPAGLTEITVLSGIVRPGGFENCTSLTRVTLGDDVSKICDYAFNGCTALTSVDIGANSAEFEIRQHAFDGCTSLTGLNVADIASWLLVDGAEYIFKNNSFAQLYIGGERPTSIVIPEGVSKINDYAFYGCDGVTMVQLADSVTEIGKYAFAGVSGITELKLPSALTTIGQYAFKDCSKVQSITVPDSVTAIEGGAFSGWSSLVSIIVPFVGRMNYKADSSNQYPLGYIFGDTEYAGGVKIGQEYIEAGGTKTGYYYIPSSLRSVTVTGGRVIIGAFDGCTNITDVTLKSGVTEVMKYAFRDCTSLTRVELADTVTSLADYSFYNCTSLSSITIPAAVTYIGKYCFGNCTSLTSATVLSAPCWWGTLTQTRMYLTEDAAQNAKYLSDWYVRDYWTRLQ